jgi:hypothetical protein
MQSDTEFVDALEEVAEQHDAELEKLLPSEWGKYVRKVMKRTGCFRNLVHERRRAALLLHQGHGYAGVGQGRDDSLPRRGRRGRGANENLLGRWAK